MKKRLLSSLLALVMLASLLPSSALAVEDGDVLLEEDMQNQEEVSAPEIKDNSASDDEPLVHTEDITVYCDGLGSVYDIGEPAMRFALMALTLDSDIATFSGSYYNQLDTNSQVVYNAILESYLGTTGASTDQVALNNVSQHFANVQFIYNEERNAWSFDQSAESYAAISNWATDCIVPAYLALIYDNPTLSWLVNIKYSYGISFSFDTSPTTQDSPYTIGATISIPYFYLPSVTEVTTGDNATGDMEDINSAITAATSTLEAAPYSISSSSTVYEKVKAIHDYICTTVAYTSNSNLTHRRFQTVYSALISHETVCAGYAKAFKVLCDEYNIPCVLVSGNGVTKQTSEDGEAHMWNYVQMEDNKWYAVDCTWDDQANNGTYSDFFLVGNSTVDTYFGKKPFSASHIPSGTWSADHSDYTFVYPELNATAYTPPKSDFGTAIVTLESTSYTYDGTAKTPSVTVKIGNEELDASRDYTVSYANNFNAGTASVTVTATENSDYTGSKTVEFTIGKALLTHSITGTATKEYDGSVNYNGTGLTVTLNGIATVDQNQVTATATYIYNDANVGTGKTITASGITLSGTAANNYQLSTTSASTIGTITPKNITVTIDNIPNQVYTGIAITPTVTVASADLVNNDTLALDTDYTVTYSNNTNIGIATVTVSAKSNSNYTWSSPVTAQFTITAMAIPDNVKSSITGYTGTYDGNSHPAASIDTTVTGEYTFTYSTAENGNYVNIVPTVTNVSDSKTIWVKISKDNYAEAIICVTATVNAKSLTDSMVTGIETSYGYTGTKQEPSVTVTDNSALTSGTDYSVSYGANTNVTDTCSVTVTGQGNYTGTVTKNFTITPAALSVSGITIKAKPYDGNVSAELDCSDATLSSVTSDDVSFVTLSTNGVTAAFVDQYVGTDKKVTITGDFTLTGDKADNYTLTQPTDLTGNITAIQRVITSNYTSDTNAYSLTKGNTIDLRTLVSDNANSSDGIGFTIDNSTSATLESDGYTLKSGDTEGTVTITVSGEAHDMNADNTDEYTVAASITIYVKIVNKTTDTSTLKVSQAGCAYGDTLSAPISSGVSGAGTVTYSYSGTLQKDNSTYGPTDTMPTEAGNYTVTATCEDSTTIYTGTANFTISAKNINGASIVLSSSLTYDGTTQTQTVTSVTVDGKVLATNDYTLSGNTGTNADTYTLTVNGTGNYTGTATTIFTIFPKPVTISGATATARPYNGTTGVAIESVTFSETGLTDYTATGTMVNADAGDNKNVTVTVALTNTNYTLGDNSSTTTTVNISKAAALDLADKTVGVRYNTTGTQTVTLAGLMPADAGALSYTAGTATGQTSIISTWSVNTDDGTVSYTLTGGVVNNTVTLPVIIHSANYEDSTANVVITLTDLLAQDTLTLTSSTNVTYGDTLALTTTGGSGTGAVTYTVTDGTGAATVSGSALTPVKAGTVTVVATKSADDTYTATTSAPVTITIDPRNISGASITLGTALTYDGTVQTQDVASVAVNGTTLVTEEYTLSSNTGTNAGTYTLTVTGTGNYTGTATKQFTIVPKTVTITGASAADRVYNGSDHVDVTGVTFADAVSGDTLNYTASGTMTDANAGTGKAVTVTVTLTDQNYTLGTANTTTATVTISKAAAPTLTSKNVSVKYNETAAQTVSLTGLMPADAGTLTYTAGVKTDSDSIIDSWSVTGGTLTYTLTSGLGSAKAGKTAALPVTIGSANYESATVSVTVTLTDLQTQAPLTITSGADVTYGGTLTLTTAGGSGSGAVTYTVTNGTGAATVSDSTLTPTKAGTVTIVAVKAADGAYAAATSAPVTITIAKATPTGKPAYTAIKTSGKTLAASGLTTVGSTFSVPGTVAWDLPETTTVKANTAYTWTFTPENDNYAAISGKITLWRYTEPSTPSTPSTPSRPSTGSNTSSNVILPVTTDDKRQDGVVTTETTAAPKAKVRGDQATADISSAIADEIVRQAMENGSHEVVIAPVISGGVTKTEVSIPASAVGEIGRKTDAVLTVSTPVAAVTIPNGGLSGLATEGGAITVTAEKQGNTVDLSVTAGSKAIDRIPGGITLTVPHDDCRPGTVAVLVNASGATEVVRKSLANDGALTVTIPLDGSAKLEIVDNSKAFLDVPFHNWAADAVAFVSAHELFNGTSETTFSPEASMTRSMLAVVLHNLENNPSQRITNSFSDVSSTWYTEAVCWAVDRGIVTGYPDGTFGPEAPITREQLAVMLWRYAGSPISIGSFSSFTDADEISDYAVTAMRWAVENGVMNGKGGGILDPKGTATRAEVAQMLQNLMENVG